MNLGPLAHAIASGLEELVEHVVLVGRQDQMPNGQTHLARDMTGEDVAEVPGRHSERHWFADLAYHGEICFEVVDRLRDHAGPIDRVDRADAVARLEACVAAYAFDDVLAIIEHATDANVEDVGILQR